MKKRGKTGPVGRGFLASYLGLALGYGAFFGGAILVGVLGMVEGNDLEGDAKLLLFAGMLLLIPLAFLAPLLALVIVMPVDYVLSSCRAIRSVYWVAGMSLGALAGFAILESLCQIERSLLGLHDRVLWGVPMLAAVITGWVIGDQLWRRRKREEA